MCYKAIVIRFSRSLAMGLKLLAATAARSWSLLFEGLDLQGGYVDRSRPKRTLSIYRRDSMLVQRLVERASTDEHSFATPPRPRDMEAVAYGLLRVSGFVRHS